jgi:hypothetical protein
MTSEQALWSIDIVKAAENIREVEVVRPFASEEHE